MRMHSLLLPLLLIPLTILSGCAVEAPRAARPMFKGVELYSWVDPATQDWRFALVPGTNRNKTVAEILNTRDAAHSVVELKARISRFAPSESVFWLVPKTGGFSLPRKDVVDGIIAHAESVGVSVRVTVR